ncbi:COR domain-containing protein [Kitasatospora sp. NPDC004240]
MRILKVRGNRISALPQGLAGLQRLKSLDLSMNRLEELPEAITGLPGLTGLVLGLNPLRSLPAELGRLTGLEMLWLDDVRLRGIPACVGDLWRLQVLSVRGLGLTELPPFMNRLQDLVSLDVSRNSLVELPTFLGALPHLSELNVEGNPLLFPPPEVVAAGPATIRSFLASAQSDPVRQWASKVVVVGEGRVGKTSLLRALRGEQHNPREETTHGLAVGRLDLDHPAPPSDAGDSIEMQLATWDFGGQEIYHATHQFFLTDRSLFLLLWDSQAGWEAGKIHYWLDMIKARAPQAPVVLVATHLGPRPPDLPLTELRDSYPGLIVASAAVDSATGEGVDEVRELVRAEAARLPLMGARWPRHWLAAADAVRAHRAKHVEPEELRALMALEGVTERDSQDSLTAALHSLGDLLYYPEDEELRDLVVLRPQWLTTYISRVLDSHEVLHERGVFRHAYGDELWIDVERPVRRHFIPMMEKFDLSYRTDDGIGSLVVELLPWEPPEYQQRWEDASEERELRLRYHLHTVPPGIPTWFLARSHRFSTGLHWRSGALFAHPDGAHLGLITVDRHAKTAEISVRGPYPNDFFAVLKDGFEQTLARYPGLDISRTVPCPDRADDGAPCPHEFQYEQLVARLVRNPPRELIECPAHLDDLPVRMLLQGIAPPQLAVTNQLVELTNLRLAQLGRAVTAVGDRVGDEAERSRNQFAAMLAEQQRTFLSVQRAGQSRQEVLCPGVIAVEQVSRKRLRGLAPSGKRLLVHLYCEAPGEWHRLEGVEPYEVPVTSERLAVLVPYAERVATVLKFAVPVVGAGFGALAEDTGKAVKDQMELAKSLLDGMPEEFRRLDVNTHLRATRHSEFRALQAVLTGLDPEQRWGGLDKVTTPEGHTYWLCERHAAAFRPVGALPARPPEGVALPGQRDASAGQRALGSP